MNQRHLSAVEFPQAKAAGPLRRIEPRRRGRLRGGFSMVELLIALTISSMLLAACLVALDSSFKSYESTTETAATHVVSRLVMHRMLTMIRQGEEFGPYPYSVLEPTQLESTYVEFVSYDNEYTGERQVTRLERVEDPTNEGMFVLQYRRWDYLNGVQVDTSVHPLLRNLIDMRFTLEYDRGPRLRRLTIDMSVRPEDARTNVTAIHTTLAEPVLRLIASTSPRRLD
jgi:prepilin-type N-terminal cleavage/methylation domain-containing protein